jgi:hypothetical protein
MRRKAAWVGSKPSEGNHTRIAVTAKRSTEEGFGGGDVARSTEVGFYGFTLFIFINAPSFAILRENRFST